MSAGGSAPSGSEGGPGRVVVGVDGSAPARHALRWAGAEATRRGAALEVVLAWTMLVQPGDAVGRPGFEAEDAQRALEGVVQETLGDQRPDAIVLTVVNDLAVTALLERAVGADLLVVGSRGSGGFRGLVLGSVSSQLARHAPCPVVIVPGERPRAHRPPA